MLPSKNFEVKQSEKNCNQSKKLYSNCGAPGNLFRSLELAQLTGGGLGRSKPATNLMQAH
jgi:hypothetical protein